MEEEIERAVGEAGNKRKQTISSHRFKLLWIAIKYTMSYIQCNITYIHARNPAGVTDAI